MKQNGTRQDASRGGKVFDNRERLRTHWPELRGRAQERWSRLNDEWLDEVNGRYDQLAGKLREAYGVTDQEANRQVDDFVETHWAALSTGNMTPGSVSTGAKTSAKPHVHPPGETRVRKHDERKSSVGPGTIEPGGRDI